METKTIQKKQANVLPVGQALLKNGFVDIVRHYDKEEIQDKHKFCSDGYHEIGDIDTKHYSIFLRMTNRRNATKNSLLFCSDRIIYNAWGLNDYFKPIPEKALSEIVRAYNCGVSYDNMRVVEISISKAINKKPQKIKDPLVYTIIDGKILKIAFWK